MKKQKNTLIFICLLTLGFSLALFVLSFFWGGPVGGGVVAFLMRFLLSIVPLLLVTLLIQLIRLKGDGDG